MKAQFTVKSLVAALATIKPHVTKVGNGDNTAWTERNAHQWGYDHVIIRIVDGCCTLYAVMAETSRKESNAHPVYCTFVPVALHRDCQRADYAPVEDGSFAVPVKVILDYARTFGSADVLTIATEDLKTELLDKTGHYSGKFTSETRLTITCGRNKCSIVGKNLEDMPAINFDGVETVEVPQEPIKVTYNTSYHIPTPAERTASIEANMAAYYDTMIGQCSPWSPDAMHGPAYVAKPRVRVPLATMQACSPRWVATIARDEADDTITATIEAITGEGYAPMAQEPAQPATIVPTAIYTPAVGDTVQICYQHERMTTDRIVTVQRVSPDGKTFRGYDRTYDRVRNYDMARVLTIRRLGGEGVEIAAG